MQLKCYKICHLSKSSCHFFVMLKLHKFYIKTQFIIHNYYVSIHLYIIINAQSTIKRFIHLTNLLLSIYLRFGLSECLTELGSLDIRLRTDAWKHDLIQSSIVVENTVFYCRVRMHAMHATLGCALVCA